VKPLSYQTVFRDRWASRIGENWALLLGKVADLSHMFRPSGRRLPDGFTVATNQPFDGRFDQLRAEAVKQFDFIGDRSSAYLSWRFGRFPEHPYNTFAIFNRQRALAGYVVYARHGKRVTIADLLTTSASLWEVLLAEFLRQMRSAGAETVSFKYFGLEQIESVLTALGFKPRGKDTTVFVHSAAITTPDGLLRWFLTEADRDA
jgi:hypothetical protein